MLLQHKNSDGHKTSPYSAKCTLLAFISILLRKVQQKLNKQLHVGCCLLPRQTTHTNDHADNLV